MAINIQLRGMTWDHPRGYDPMAATARAYTKSHPDVSIVWKKRSLQAFADHPLNDLAAKYDLIVIDHPHAGFASRDGCLVSLDGAGRSEQLAAIASESIGPSHVSYQYQGHQWALAIDAATQVAAYRPDLISAGEVPTHWEQVIELAKAGRVLWPLKPIDAVSSFNSLAANQGTPINTQEEKVIDCDAGRAVLEAVRAVAQYVPSECLAMNPPQILDWMSQAENEQYAYCPLLYGYTNYARDGYANRLVRFTNIPALGDKGPGGTQLGGTGIAVSSKCKHREVAVDYAFWIAGADCQRTLFFDANGQPGNAAAWDDEHCNAAASNFFRDTRATLDRAWVRPTSDGYLDYQDQAGARINQCLVYGEDFDEVLSDLNGIYKASMRKVRYSK